jgi:hypothetical protein
MVFEGIRYGLVQGFIRLCFGVTQKYLSSGDLRYNAYISDNAGELS